MEGGDGGTELWVLHSAEPAGVEGVAAGPDPHDLYEQHITEAGEQGLGPRAAGIGFALEQSKREVEGRGARVVPSDPKDVGKGAKQGVHSGVFDIHSAYRPDDSLGLDSTVIGVTPDPTRLADLAQALAAGELVTTIAHVVPLSEGPARLAAVAAGGVAGKVVLTTMS